jgi:hypothetical protein
VADQLIDLVPTIQANAFSLVNLPVGVYTLDIITQKGNAKTAYEGILVINQQPTTIINETTKQIINQEINRNSRVDIDTKIIFKEDTPKSKPPIVCPADMTNDGEKCIPLGCPEGFVRDVNGRCSPICDDIELPEGEVCYDEGDPTDPIDPPICTPDGPECPPCPEGVEAGWCADEDERGDFDCGDEGMENDPRCKDGEPVNGSEELIKEELPEEETPTVVPPPEEEEEEEPEGKELEEEEEEEEEELPEEVEGQVEEENPSEDGVTKEEN